MTRGSRYFETFKAELSLVILCLTSQELLLTLKPALLNGCVCPPLMCTSINKRCRCWQFLLAFIHISPLRPCKSKNHPEDGSAFFAALALIPVSDEKQARPIAPQLSCFTSRVSKVVLIQNEAVNYGVLN